MWNQADAPMKILQEPALGDSVMVLDPGGLPTPTADRVRGLQQQVQILLRQQAQFADQLLDLRDRLAQLEARTWSARWHRFWIWLRLWLPLVLLLGCVPSASAQAITSYTVRFYASGSNSVVPGTPYSFTGTITCDQASPAAGSTTNPTRVVWDDLTHAGRVCLWVAPSPGLFTQLTNGTYTGTLTASNSNGEGPESTAAPFTIAKTSSSSILQKITGYLRRRHTP